MQGNSKKKTGALIAAAVIVILAAALIAFFVFIIKGEDVAGADGILWIYVALLASVAVGVLAALRQRFKEIKKGEEDEAKKY